MYETLAQLLFNDKKGLAAEIEQLKLFSLLQIMVSVMK
jgi:hypothetical protein